jgi:hypothetical protein
VYYLQDVKRFLDATSSVSLNHTVLYCDVLYCILLSYLILSYLILSYLILSYLILSYPIFSRHALYFVFSTFLFLYYIVLSHHLRLILFHYILLYDAEPNGIFRPENEWTRQAHLETTGTKSGEQTYLLIHRLICFICYFYVLPCSCAIHRSFLAAHTHTLIHIIE